MRKLSLAFSFLVAVTLAAVVLLYLERRIGEHRIYVQDEWLASADSVSQSPAALAKRCGGSQLMAGHREDSALHGTYSRV